MLSCLPVLRWFSLLLSLTTVACVDTSAEGPLDSPTPLQQQLGTAAVQNILWIGAHPDDETFATPLMADLCLRQGATCHFAVITDGGAGNCQLSPQECGVNDTGGAPPGSLGALRLREQAQVASAFGGKMWAVALQDSSSNTVLGTLQRWNQMVSGVPGDQRIEQITQVVENIVTASQADVIFTFDPRHGMYCHPDHRAAAYLAVTAANRLGFDPSRVLMLESTSPYVDLAGQLTMRPWVPADPALLRYDAIAAGTRSALPATLSIYKSQFSAQAVAALAALSAESWQIPFVPVSAVLGGGGFEPAAYDQICAAQVPWDGRGTCPRGDGSTGPCW